VAGANFFAGPVKAAAEDAFDDPVIGGCGCAHTDAEVDLPPGTDIEIDAGKYLLLLLVERVGVAQVAVVGVVLDGAVDLFGEVKADRCARRKVEAKIHVGAMPGAFEGGIDGKIPAADLFVDDGANLPCPCVWRKQGALIADLGGETYADGPVPAFGDAHAGADVVADPRVAEAALL